MWGFFSRKYMEHESSLTLCYSQRYQKFSISSSVKLPHWKVFACLYQGFATQPLHQLLVDVKFGMSSKPASSFQQYGTKLFLAFGWKCGNVTVSARYCGWAVQLAPDQRWFANVNSKMLAVHRTHLWADGCHGLRRPSDAGDLVALYYTHLLNNWAKPHHFCNHRGSICMVSSLVLSLFFLSFPLSIDCHIVYGSSCRWQITYFPRQSWVLPFS